MCFHGRTRGRCAFGERLLLLVAPGLPCHLLLCRSLLCSQGTLLSFHTCTGVQRRSLNPSLTALFPSLPQLNPSADLSVLPPNCPESCPAWLLPLPRPWLRPASGPPDESHCSLSSPLHGAALVVIFQNMSSTTICLQLSSGCLSRHLVCPAWPSRSIFLDRFGFNCPHVDSDSANIDWKILNCIVHTFISFKFFEEN